MATTIQPPPLIPLLYQQIDLTTVQTLIPPTVVVDGDSYKARTAHIIAEGNGYRYRDDGVNPTDAVGMPVDVGQPAKFENAATQMLDLRVVSQVGTSKLNISWYR